MSKEKLHDLMRGALKASDADQTEVVAVTSDSALTWYAENIIHQNVAEHTAQAQVRVVVGKKVGTASTTDCSPEGLVLVERGIYVTRFWYGNPVEPQRAVVTGTTCDGTYLIENGHKASGIRNLRFTQGLVDMFAHTVEIDRNRAVLASSFGIGAMVLPSIRVEGFHFTGMTR
ncbi:MAG: metallopeptidase TldD-related protein [Candidatus Cryosericum sp.]